MNIGAGAYICSEETALINSLQGKWRANPRLKLPFQQYSAPKSNPKLCQIM